MHFSCVALLLLVGCAGLALGQENRNFELEHIASWSAGDVQFDANWVESALFDGETGRIFSLNTGANRVDVVDISTITTPTMVTSWPLTEWGSNARAIAIHGDVLAVAISTDASTPGTVVFFETNGNMLTTMGAGYSPKDLVFTPDGKKVIVANEGVPSDDLSFDPPGTVSVITLALTGNTLPVFSAANVGASSLAAVELDFEIFDIKRLDDSIRIFNQLSGSALLDLEPESIALESSGYVAWIVLQENNAVARVDIGDADDDDSNDNLEITDVLGLGYSDAFTAADGFDGSASDSAIRIIQHPVRQLRLADGVANFHKDGIEYLVMANEGSKRTFAQFDEVSSVAAVTLDFTAFPTRANLQESKNIGRLEISTVDADTDGDGDIDVLYAFGSRSFTIYDVSSTSGIVELFDSRAQIETIVASRNPVAHNAADKANQSFDSQSIKAGPTPEGVAVGEINGRHYAFVTLEQTGGVMMWELLDIDSPTFKAMGNTRDYSVSINGGNFATAGDMGPGHVQFVPASSSPTETDLVIVSNEVSGTVSLFQVNEVGDGIYFSSGYYSVSTVSDPVSSVVDDSDSYDPIPNTDSRPYYRTEYFTLVDFGSSPAVGTYTYDPATPGALSSRWYTSYWTIDNFKNVRDESTSDAASLSSCSLLFVAAFLCLF